MSGKLHTRRRRRQARAAIGNQNAKPRHRLKTGRTGSVHSKRLKSLRR